MDNSVIDLLNRPLEVHYKPGPGGKKYKYVEGRDVIASLNAAFGHSWSSSVINTLREDTQVIVLIKLEANGESHQGYGGAEIALYSYGDKQGKPVDISNSYKAAFTNALKKAAEQFGVGLFLTKDPPRAQPAPAPAPVQSGAPVSSSVVMTNSNTAVPSNVSVDGLNKHVQEKVAELLAAAPAPQPAAPLPSPIVQNTPSGGYNPESARVPESTTPFEPSGNEEENINSIQLNAIRGISRMKKITPEDLISRALPNSTKTKYEDLTNSEAKIIIPVLNSIKNS